MLITTRGAALRTLALGIDLLPMRPEEGVRFLLSRAKVLEPAATPEQMQQFAVRSPTDYAAAEELVTALGGLPLALDQAGAYSEETGCSLADYSQRYEQQRALAGSSRDCGRKSPTLGDHDLQAFDGASRARAESSG